MTKNSLQRTPNPWRVAVVAGWASYIDAAAIVSFGTAIVIYQSALGLTPEEVGLGAGALTLGIAVGALAGGRLGDRFGRRPVFTVTMIVIVIGALALVFADSFPLVISGAILLGLGTGADLPVSLSTISEAASDTNRGKLLGLSNLLWLAGGIVSGAISVVVGGLGRFGGQVLFAHIAVVALVVMIARLSIPESASWAAAREERRAGVTARADRSSGRALLRKPYLTPFLGLLVFYAFTNLAANTGGQFGTYLLVNLAGVDVPTAALAAVPILPLVVIGTLWFMKIADTPRRFTYFTVGAVLWIIALLIPAVFGFTLITYVASSVLGVAGAVFSFEGIMKVWTQEQFPTLFRTTAQGAIIAVARLFAAILATVTPSIVAVSPNMLYGLLALFAAIGLGTAWAVFRTRDSHNEFDEESLREPESAADTSVPLP
jgi:inositol transporter-like SP family MFS transporter